MASPTKADLQSAVARLAAENAELRDLIAAVHAAADCTPQAVSDDRDAERRREHEMLIRISALTGPDTTSAHLDINARQLRGYAATPVGYRVYDDAARDVNPPSAAEVAASHKAVTA